MSPAAQLRAKFFPPARPIVMADPGLWRKEQKVLAPAIGNLFTKQEVTDIEERARRRGYMEAMRDSSCTLPCGEPRQVLERICEMYGITYAELKGFRRSHHLVEARMYASVLMSRDFGIPVTTIGRHLGKDHSTICNLLERAAGNPIITKNGSPKRRQSGRFNRSIANPPNPQMRTK